MFSPCKAYPAENIWFPEGEKLWKLVDGGLVESGSLIFSDNFDGETISSEWKLDGAHMWKIENNALTNARYGGQITLTKETGDNFIVEVKVRPVVSEPEKGGGFTGVRVAGISFTMQPDRWWWHYRKEGEQRGRGQWKTEEIKFNRWYEFRIIKRGGVFEWFVDGRKICDIMEPGMEGELALMGWRIKTAYDGVRVYKINEETTMPGDVKNRVNVVRNSSFEDSNENLPPYWQPVRSLSIPIDFETMENFWNSFTVDTSEKYHGSASLRLKGGDKWNGLLSHWINVQKGKSYTLSVFLKSDVEKMPVNISLWGIPRKQVEAGRDWQRFSFTFPEINQGRTRIMLNPSAEGCLWVDAVQIEEGSETTDFRVNQMDNRTDVEMQKVELPEYGIVRVKEPPVIDGKLADSVWNKKTMLPALKIPGSLPGQYFEPKEKTEAYICHDEDNLYLALKCYTGSVRVLPKDEEIEIFLDVNLDRTTYYRFIVNPAGRVSEDDTLNLSWNADWVAETNIREEYWTAEVAVPLSSLGISPLTGTSWGINVARTNRKTGDGGAHIALSTNRGMYYHAVGRYPVFKWEDPGVFKRYLFSIEELALRRGENGTAALSGIIRNNSNRDMEVLIEAEISGIKAISPALGLERDRSQPFSLSGFPAPVTGEAMAKIRMSDVSTDGILREINRHVEQVSLIRAVASLSYYTSEENAYVHTELGIAGDALAESSITWELKRDGVRVKHGTKLVSGSKNILEIPVAGIPPATYELTVTLLDGENHEIASEKDLIRKLEPRDNEVKVDRIRRVLLVDGEPFFVFAPLQVFHVPSGHPYGNYDHVIDTLMEWWANHGFNTLHVGANVDEIKGHWGERIWDRVFKAADKHGIKVIVFWTGHWHRVLCYDHEKLEKLISKWKDNPALLAWMPSDEPEIYDGVKPEDVAAGIMKVKKLDPYHPVYINYTQIGPVSRYAGLPGDIMSLDYYLTAVDGRTIEETLRFVDIMEELSKQRNIPTWNFIVGNNLSNHHREITAEEQIAQTYGNVIGGASGLQYLFGQIYGRRHWEAYKRLNVELQSLAPVLFSGEETDQAAVSPSTVLSITRRYRGKAYIIAVNIYEREIPAVFDVSGMADAKEAKVLFEDRTLKTERGAIRDTFMPFQRHVYEISFR